MSPGRVRAQTTMDFAVGIGIFLVALALVFGFLPSVFAPFQTQTGANAVTAERSADRLASDLLVEDPARPVALNDTCTASFFNTSGSDPAGCRYDSDAADLTDALGVRSLVNVNVTVQNASSIRSVAATTLAAGPEVDAGASVVTTRRTVSVGGEISRLVVRVW
jgi:hypothetical protein